MFNIIIKIINETAKNLKGNKISDNCFVQQILINCIHLAFIIPVTNYAQNQLLLKSQFKIWTCYGHTHYQGIKTTVNMTRQKR